MFFIFNTKNIIFEASKPISEYCFRRSMVAVSLNKNSVWFSSRFLLKKAVQQNFPANTLSLARNPTCWTLWKNKVVYTSIKGHSLNFKFAYSTSLSTRTQFWERHLLEIRENLLKVLIYIHKFESEKFLANILKRVRDHLFAHSQIFSSIFIQNY